ncbi:MAG: ABC transporter ATP-binding protein [Elusimicrobiota bacterium]|nr:ABC transporter ATP-binding protein [Elusimicrobiota bacterium]
MLRIENLTAGYNTKFQLKNISFEVKQGELFGIIGPNGSGKTTLLRTITKLLKIQKGKIFFKEKDIRNIPVDKLAKEIAVVSQSQYPAFEGVMTVEDFVLLGRIPHRRKLQFFETSLDKKIAEESMQLTDTLHLKTKLITELSGGERQLIFIARALAQEPKMLLLDEPTTHLDITHQIKILNLLRKLNSEFGLTVIAVLHDLNLASEYCDNLLLLNNGYIHKIGRPEEVITHQTIEEVYKTVVVVQQNPISLKPHLFLVSKMSNKCKK